MTSEFSYRSTGREASGRLYKGRVFSETEKPGTGVTSAKSSARAFGSQSMRFRSAETLTPGPGNYEMQSLPGTAPNFSVASSDKRTPEDKWKSRPKCFGTSSRFTAKQYRTLAPGPGSYNSLPTASGHVLKSVFVLPKPRPSKTAKLQNPAPWQYNPVIPTATRAAAASFKSTSKRLSEIASAVGPSPWQYNPSFSLVRSTSAQLSSTFKLSVKEKREQLNVYDPYQQIPPETNPGPGSYDPPRTFEEKLTQVPTSVFIPSEMDRFGNNPKSQLPVRPEPGSYSKVLEVREKLPVSGAVFMSESERDWMHKGVSHPGPAFYRSQLLPKKLSFLRNDSAKWV